MPRCRLQSRGRGCPDKERPPSGPETPGADSPHSHLATHGHPTEREKTGQSVYVCVCEGHRDREKERERQREVFCTYLQYKQHLRDGGGNAGARPRQSILQLHTQNYGVPEMEQSELSHTRLLTLQKGRGEVERGMERRVRRGGCRVMKMQL